MNSLPPRRSPLRPRALLAAAVLSLPLALAGCGDALNQDTFDEIQTGMTRAEVEDILGSEGTSEEVGGVSISGAGIAGGSRVATSIKTYSWSEGKEQIVIDFAEGKVLSKRKIGF